MAIDIQNEKLIPFREVPAWCKEHVGKRIHPSTIHRWRLRGTRSVKLETLLVGGARYTSAEALARFFARTTAAADGETVVIETEEMNSKAIADAQAFLDSEGV